MDRLRAPAPTRLRPSLLDRLIDMDPDWTEDPPVTTAETFEGIRAALRRDLELLMNTRCLTRTPPNALPELADSLVTYGVEDFFSASLTTEAQRQAFAQGLEARIARFEPRLEEVSVSLVADPVPSRRTLRMRISGRYTARPGLPPLVFETAMDPVAGRFSVAPASAKTTGSAGHG